MYDFIPDNPYLLLTPGPLSTSKGVRNAMLRDWCTWDADYNEGVVQDIRRRLVLLAGAKPEEYAAVLMQGSGSFAVESCIGSAVPKSGRILILHNGAYGRRMVQIAGTLGIDFASCGTRETRAHEASRVAEILDDDPLLTHVALVHCETTTGIVNPLEDIAREVKSRKKVLIVDAMSSFGGIPIDTAAMGIDFLISSSNKCIQGAPGFAFVIARREALSLCAGNARSLCLDLYDQWREMDQAGKWRYTSPTHIVHAFRQALDELDAEGGVPARNARYRENHRTLVEGMRAMGFMTLLDDTLQSPVITSFRYPNQTFDFPRFYNEVKQRGFVLYPGKISEADTFRIGNIGDVYPSDIEKLLKAIKNVVADNFD
jgi:2-aminoethylphosphonate-pyruvate transaminase